MKKIVLRDYRTNEKLKTITVKTCDSIRYQVETFNGKKFLVVRNYSDGMTLRKCSVPSCGFTFSVEEKAQ